MLPTLRHFPGGPRSGAEAAPGLISCWAAPVLVVVVWRGLYVAVPKMRARLLCTSMQALLRVSAAPVGGTRTFVGWAFLHSGPIIELLFDIIIRKWSDCQNKAAQSSHPGGSEESIAAAGKLSGNEDAMAFVQF